MYSDSRMNFGFLSPRLVAHFFPEETDEKKSAAGWALLAPGEDVYLREQEKGAEAFFSGPETKCKD